MPVSTFFMSTAGIFKDLMQEWLLAVLGVTELLGTSVKIIPAVKLPESSLNLFVAGARSISAIHQSTC